MSWRPGSAVKMLGAQNVTATWFTKSMAQGASQGEKRGLPRLLPAQTLRPALEREPHCLRSDHPPGIRGPLGERRGGFLPTPGPE